MQVKTNLYLIDGNAYIYRAFYAIKGLSSSKGLPTNAIYGFTNMLMKIIKDKKPDYLAVTFDAKGPTLRHKEFDEYKAHRPKMPEDMAVQIPYIYRIVEAFNIPVVVKEGYEADDLIGTIVKKAEKEGIEEVIIISGDKDMMQLITDITYVYDPMRDKVYKGDYVLERFGVEPSRLVEIMGLMGDSSDNIPGIPGIGEKTAASLIAEFDNIENLLENLENVKKTKLRESLKHHRDLARLSRRLATIIIDAPIDINLIDFKLSPPNKPELIKILMELEFKRLLKIFSSETIN
ncbi:MAG: 5'-3' exonuclease H3TH domain-containing protein [Nitrospirota bacterium]